LTNNYLCDNISYFLFFGTHLQQLTASFVFYIFSDLFANIYGK